MFDWVYRCLTEFVSVCQSLPEFVSAGRYWPVLAVIDPCWPLLTRADPNWPEMWPKWPEMWPKWPEMWPKSWKFLKIDEFLWKIDEFYLKIDEFLGKSMNLVHFANPDGGHGVPHGAAPCPPTHYPGTYHPVPTTPLVYPAGAYTRSVVSEQFTRLLLLLIHRVTATFINPCVNKPRF